MKRFLVLIAVCGLIFAVSGSAFGALHYSGGDLSDYAGYGFGLPSWGGWYYIGPESRQALTGAIIDESEIFMGAQYYKDDQSFIEIGRMEDSDYLGMGFKGSYKFDGGFFLGVAHWFDDDDGSEDYYDLATLGYALDLGDNSYIALSADSYSNSDDGNGIAGIAADFRYYTDAARLYGQIYYAPEDEYMEKGTYAQVGLNYQLTAPVVIGGEFDVYSDDDYLLSAGLTWTAEPFELNCRLNYYNYSWDDETCVQVMGLYDVSDQLTIGAIIQNYDSDISQAVISKYHLNDQDSLRLCYQFGDDISMTVALYRNF